jgi:hypothetical protein
MNVHLLLSGLVPLCARLTGAAPVGPTEPSATPQRSSSEAVSLAGRWRFALDRADVGMAEAWFTRRLSDTLELPGSLPAQGIGDPVSTNTPWTGGIVDRSWFTAPEYAKYRKPGRVKVPFWLQPERYYKGAAWYQREIEIPEAWKDRRVVLFLERPHWETRVWLDDRFIGSDDSLSTPHEYTLGVGLPPGRHRLTIRVDNRLVVDVGENSHSVSDHTQGNWNGIVGRLELSALPPVWITDVQVFPRVSDRSARVRVSFANATGRRAQGKLSLFVEPGPNLTRPLTARPVSLNFDTDQAAVTTELEVALGESAELWDEFAPALYRLRSEVRGESGGRPFEHAHTTTFGLREFTTQGTQFLINGRKTFLRGTLECCIFPRTGHPPMEVGEWRRLLRAAKAHGLNLLRFHSWCPPEAAFEAADELGMYLHVECSTWPNQSTTLGDGRPVDEWLYREADRILRAYGNHPSFVLFLAGNEPGGRNHAAYLKRWVEHFKAADPRRLYAGGAGWPELPENQFHVLPEPRIQAWGAGLKSRINARPPETVSDYRDFIAARPVPVISHEIGQWCVYPNFAEIPKYTGYLKPRNFEIFRDSLRAHGMLDQAPDFLRASGRLQVLCYKEDIESALRTPGMGGFELLDLHDFPGQGTALVGVLDPFWEEKGYVTAAEYRRFCNSTVPLARLPRRVFTTAETLTAEIEVAHYGAAPLSDAGVAWKLVGEDGHVVTGGQFVTGRSVAFAELAQRPPEYSLASGIWTNLPVGGGFKAGSISVNLRDFAAPAKYRLVLAVGSQLRVRDGDFAGPDIPTPATAGEAPRLPGSSSPRRGRFENHWDLWVYPAEISTEVPNGVTVVRELDAAAEAVLNAGGRVLWLLAPERVAPDPKLGRVALGFSSIFWNTAWTSRQPPHTLGIWCDPRHPLFAAFPTDFHSNWQWWYVVTHAGAMILDDLPRALRPTVQVIDDWFTNRKLGLVFEAQVGPGRLAVCSVDLEHDLAADPVRRQFRRSLLDYVAGPHFRPATRVRLDQLRRLAAPPASAAGR